MGIVIRMSEEKRGVGRPVSGRMPGKNITCPDDLWQLMIAAAHTKDATLSGETRAFYAWYTGQPGAELPTRPNNLNS